MATTLQTRREYLGDQGLAKPGRGKFSNDGKAALAKADAEGYAFLDGPSPTRPRLTDTIKSTVGLAQSEPVVKKVDPRDTPWIAPEDYRFPEAEHEAVGQVDGKRVVYSMRECCGNCRVSLLNHSCDQPTVYGLPVKIVAK